MKPSGQQQVLVLNSKTERQQGRKAQLANIMAGKAVADVVRTCLGPQAMLKMLMDPMGGIVLTSDGNAILREIDVAHPAAKTVIELSRSQDEEVGDGTTSVIVLAGELLAHAAPLFEGYADSANFSGLHHHPISVIGGYRKALDDALVLLDRMATAISVENDGQLRKIVASTIQTKAVCAPASDLIVDLAIRAVRCVACPGSNGTAKSQFESSASIDIKRFARVEKIPGGQLEDSVVLDGVLVNKDITHPAMRRLIENPRILLLDCPLEYKKGESQTNIEISTQTDWSRALEIEEEQVRKMCDFIIALKPDVVITEKGLSDLAQHYLVSAGITALRRLRKTDNQRISRATGAKIVTRVEDAQQDDIGTGCGSFHVDKIGDEYFCFFTRCSNPKACSIILRGPSKDILNEVERCLQDAMCVARNLLIDARVVPGAGASEMAISCHLSNNASLIDPIQQAAYLAVSRAFEVIPRTLAQNCGADPFRSLSDLRVKHKQNIASHWGIDGYTGHVSETDVWEPLTVKSQTIKTAIEAACLLLRVDEIVSGTKSATSTSANAASKNVDDNEQQQQ